MLDAYSFSDSVDSIAAKVFLLTDLAFINTAEYFSYFTYAHLSHRFSGPPEMTSVKGRDFVSADQTNSGCWGIFVRASIIGLNRL